MRFAVPGLRFRVLDASPSRGATWSGQVISSPSGPSGMPLMTHLLPGGGVYRDDRVRVPFSPRLHPFVTPWSVCCLVCRLQALTHYVPP